MIYLVCTANGKILTGFDNLESAETARAYWQKRIDESLERVLRLKKERGILK